MRSVIQNGPLPYTNNTTHAGTARCKQMVVFYNDLNKVARGKSFPCVPLRLSNVIPAAYSSSTDYIITAVLGREILCHKSYAEAATLELCTKGAVLSGTRADLPAQAKFLWCVRTHGDYDYTAPAVFPNKATPCYTKQASQCQQLGEGCLVYVFGLSKRQERRVASA